MVWKSLITQQHCAGTGACHTTEEEEGGWCGQCTSSQPQLSVDGDPLLPIKSGIYKCIKLALLLALPVMCNSWGEPWELGTQQVCVVCTLAT